MASAPDMELKKAFTELQMKMVDSKQKIKFTDMQVLSTHIFINLGMFKFSYRFQILYGDS